MIAEGPCSRRTRPSSPATSSSALSHETGTNGSRPRLSPLARPSFNQPDRIIGRLMRSGEWTESGIASINGDGSGSKSKGTAPTTLPSSTTALNAPQWEWCGTNLRFIGSSWIPEPTHQAEVDSPQGEIWDGQGAHRRENEAGCVLSPDREPRGRLAAP